MSHGIHDETLGTWLFPGCAECEYRAARRMCGLEYLDAGNRMLAWAAMRATRWSGAQGWARTPLSMLDLELLELLYGIALFLQRHHSEPGDIAIIGLGVYLEERSELGLGAEPELSDIALAIVAEDPLREIPRAS